MAYASNSARMEWMWKSNKDPWNKSQAEQWSSYSDIEAAIIEDAYQKRLPEVLLNDYHISFEKSVQISNSKENSQRPVKRVQHGMSAAEPRLRESRFNPLPVHPSIPFTEQIYFLSSVGEVMNMFNVNDGKALLEPDNRRLLITKAAEGIVTEGKLLGKQKEAEWIAKQLLDVIDDDAQKIWRCCAHLYTMESFLYKKMNEYMRLCGDPQSKSLWKSKMETFGPFAYILRMFGNTTVYSKFYVYRGANLSDDLIVQFQNNIGTYLMFPAFTSTSRNRAKAEQFGNALFVIHASSTDGKDVASLSDYPDEEETLLSADFAFYIRSCTYDHAKKKWIINISSWRDD